MKQSSVIGFVVLTFLCLSAPSFAERRPGGGGGGSRGKLGALVYGGFSFANNKSEGAGSLKGTTGLAFGFGVDYRIMPQWSLGIDMLYTQKSYQLTSGASITQYDLSYLEFPFLLKWSPLKELQFKAGPYLAGLMISASRQSSGTAAALKGDFGNDYGMTFGTWIGFWASPTLAVGVDLRYDLGLANIQNVNEPRSAIKTRDLMGMLCLNFAFK